MSVVVAKQPSPSLASPQQPTTSSVSARSPPPPLPATLPPEHQVLQDVFNQLVQLCTACASHNPVNIPIHACSPTSP